MDNIRMAFTNMKPTKGTPEQSPPFNPNTNEINPMTGLPYNHVFGTTGTLQNFEVYAKRKGKKEFPKWGYYVGAIVLLFVLFGKKIKKYF